MSANLIDAVVLRYFIKSLPKSYIPKNRIVQIKPVTASNSWVGNITKDTRTGACSIKIATQERCLLYTKEYTFESVLVILAHELAHLIQWNHDHDHWDLMCKIMRHWTKTIKKHRIDTQSSWGKCVKNLSNKI